MTPACTIDIPVPSWISTRDGERFDGDLQRMRFLIGLADRNVEEERGGPFAAGVFNLDTGCLTAAAVNSVRLCGCSAAHAEMVALMRAQSLVGEPRLDQNGVYALYSSAQPCSMCYGALFWTGISQLVYGARRSDVHRITGFDEGPLPRNWKRELQRRNIAVRGGILRRECCTVLQRFRDTNGSLY